MALAVLRGIFSPPGCVVGCVCVCVWVMLWCLCFVWVPVLFLLCWLVCLVVWVGVLVVVGFVGGFRAASPPSAPIDWVDRLGLKLWVGLGGVCVWFGWVCVWVCLVVALVVCASCFRPPSPGVYLVAMRGDGMSSYRFPGHRARSLGHPRSLDILPL